MTTTEVERFQLFIDGKALDAASGQTFESQDPFRGETWAVLADGGLEDVDAAVASARSAFETPMAVGRHDG